MPTISIEIPDAEMNRLAQKAAELNVTVEELTTRIARREVLAFAVDEPAFDFEALAHELINDDKELLLRLA